MPVAGGLAAMGCLALAILALSMLGNAETLAVKPIDDREVDELSWLRFDVEVEATGMSPDRLHYSLPEAPEGAQIDARTGRFSWRPSERQGPGTHQVTVRVATSGTNALSIQRRFTVRVAEVHRPPVLQPIADRIIDARSELTLTATAEDPDSPSRGLTFRLLGEVPPGARIDAKTGQFHWDPTGADPGKTHRFKVCVEETGDDGLQAEQGFSVRLVAAEAAPSVADLAATAGDDRSRVPIDPSAAGGEPSTGSSGASQQPVSPEVPPAEALTAESDKMILGLYKRNRLFPDKQYPTLRRIFAERFEQQQRDSIRLGLGADAEAMAEWFDAHTEIQEELYTAIRPDRDDVGGALAVFNELRKRFPDQLETYAELAMATAVTWDRPDQGVYDYARHQRRTKSTIPGGLLGSVENFAYLAGGHQSLQMRAQFLPWEFLIHVVNHPTPQQERQWAMQNYGSDAKIVMYGKCYQDVPYDERMLDSQGATTALGGKPYTLENIRRFGGVCAMQADFAARVGKSIGLPAAYVGGESRFGELHAWVMWVELQNVTRNSIQFSLQSHGRYRLDQYYVGNLVDPQTGEKISDRQLELRLHTVGMSPRAKRHAALIMKAFPMLRDSLDMDVAEQLGFLNNVINRCPGNEDAWSAIAQMSRNGTVTKKHDRAMMVALEKLFQTFAAFPDFTWEVFDDLVAYQDVRKQRARLFGRLVLLYEQAGRPDLACKARLRYTEYLVEDKQYAEAVDGLGLTIMQFPEEGRYVPQMLDKLEEICRLAAGQGNDLLDFYQAFLPKIPRMRGDRLSEYCVEMYERGITRFREGGRPELAQFYQAQLAAVQAGRRRAP
ncbi:MAG: hypothetical protein JXB62_12085 [Pirellulales bacterium]|nr:hypothetical protein [Pirellulales bacterium]